MDFKKSTILEIAVFLCDHLTREGIDTVLSGGACVSIYTENRYLSYDLDFVLLDYSKRKKIRAVLERIGYFPEGRHFRHPDTPFIVEFLSPPLSVGEEPVKKILTIEKRGFKLKLLSPTDCVKDRLAAFYFWKDRPSLEQAVMVSVKQSVDLDEIKRWSLKEGKKEEHLFFLDELKRSRKSLSNIS